MFVAMFCHVVGYFATAIYLLVHVNPKNAAQYVFADFTNLSGWESPGVRDMPPWCDSSLTFSTTDCLVNWPDELSHWFRWLG